MAFKPMLDELNKRFKDILGKELSIKKNSEEKIIEKQEKAKN